MIPVSAVAKFLLVMVLQHFLYHTAALPHLKHRLAVLVAHFLSYAHSRSERSPSVIRLPCPFSVLTAISSNLLNSRVR